MNKDINQLINNNYQAGFESDVDSNVAPCGISEEVIRGISYHNKEPDFILEWRLKAYRHWLTMREPHWGNFNYKAIDYQNISYHSAPKNWKPSPKDLTEIDPEILSAYQRLGIPLQEQKRLAGVAIDVVFDSVSVITTFKDKLSHLGIVFCSMSEAVHEYPELIQKWMGSVVPYYDNFYAALNAAVFSAGTFCYIPKGVACPMELSSYFRINTNQIGQFERTLIVAEEGSSVSYLEGCTAPMRDEHQLHAAVVELVALDRAHIKYSTVQNWYPGNSDGVGGIYNFVTKRGHCLGKDSEINWIQIETGSAITWKYPSVTLFGHGSKASFYSVAMSKHYQQADTGTKMIHIGKNTSSTIMSKSIVSHHGQNTYRGLVRVAKSASNARNYTQCDSLLIKDQCGSHTIPDIEVNNYSAQVEHEASSSKVSDEQLFYLSQRGFTQEDALSLIVNGFCKEILSKLPMEFAVEAQKLVKLNLEGAVG